MKSVSHEFDSLSGHLFFSSTCSVVIIPFEDTPEILSLMMNKLFEICRMYITINGLFIFCEQKHGLGLKHCYWQVWCVLGPLRRYVVITQLRYKI